MVEQRTENPCVPGSIPGGTTTKNPNKCSGFLVLIGIYGASQKSFNFLLSYNLLTYNQPMHSLYIIYSKSKDKFYVGETEDISLRLEKHNNHSYKGSFTKIASDWEIVLDYKCLTKVDALFMEAFIKRMKSKKFIYKIIENHNVIKDILNKR